MPRWLKALLIVAALAWAVVVYRPYLLGTDADSRGFLGGDLETLVEAAGPGDAQLVALQDMSAADYVQAAGAEGSFLGGASLALSRRLWGVNPSSAFIYRLENLLLLVALGLGLGHFVRRLLVPWTGLDHARAAARGVPVVMGLHPFTVHAVARIGARPEFLSMALGAWAAASYLRARQERKPGGVLLAGALAVLAHLAGGFGFGLAILLALAEGLAVQRYQSARRRVLRGLTTGLVFLGLASVELAVRGAFDVPLASQDRLPHAVGGVFERFAIVLVPLPLAGLLAVLPIALFLVAMHPALRAARAAPRLWGYLLFVWAGVLLATLLLHVGDSRVRFGDFTSAADLFPAAVIWCAGLVIVATGVQGFRRLVLPVALAVGLGVVSLAQAWTHTSAVRATHRVRSAVEAGALAALDLQRELAREGRGSAAGPSVIVLDPPSTERELPIDPFRAGIGFYLDPSLTGKSNKLQPPLLARPAALVAFARQPEFDVRRRGGLVVVRPRTSEASAAQVVRLPAPSPLEVPPLWRSDPLSPELNLDPLNFGAVVTVVEGAPPAGGLPTSLTFRGRASAPPAEGARGSSEGVWVRSRGRIEGRFDVGAELDWLLAGRITRVGFESGLARLASGQFHPDLLGLEQTGDVEFERVGRDWRTAIPAEGAELRPLVPDQDDQFVLVQLDLVSLALRELVADTSGAGQLRFADAEVGARAVAWMLERRVAGHTIWRTGGRTEGPAPAEPVIE